MASFNRVILVGNLTRDIELRYIPSGQAVSDVTIAVNDRRKTANGDWVEEPCFVDVTLWGRNAEVASEYLSKGSPVLIEGRLKLDRWETDGQKRSKLRVICEKMQMLGGRSGSGGSPPSSGSSRQHTAEYESSYGSGEHEQRDAGARDAQPTGGGAGYEDPNIPF
ncbi:single-stranded DNA-binding protein [Roseiconus lacunae]|uniref:Single-stranded DNA-binding protein n=1 Tax=Roseiconus lacunae TaxID=2605694 RepID=A0ABT7PKM6_9BACT|nr:single-stranded DNA-binding protein [Roseiconus lacunae]MCD0460704.1 single-stranded DNA-binding protein [Roseiconus lacunae]MDM4017057.1 single-stranded DNA-binding protein [Roseiconus lacunae]WRQ51362.1 single-stranded DNA-binding protein [Stieleria sp. HD01]